MLSNYQNVSIQKTRNLERLILNLTACCNVCMTSKTPKERFIQHKRGYRNKKGYKLSANIVEKYGAYLRPSLYNHIDPIVSRADALKMERILSLELRRQGYAVWFN